MFSPPLSACWGIVRIVNRSEESYENGVSNIEAEVDEARQWRLATASSRAATFPMRSSLPPSSWRAINLSGRAAKGAARLRNAHACAEKMWGRRSEVGEIPQ